jgi:hypothetical protein
MICEYCKKELKNKSSLNYHQKTAKYCLKLQDKENPIVTDNENKEQCQICMKYFTKRHIISHIQNSCITNINDLNNFIKQLRINNEDEIKQKEDEIKQKEDEIKQKEDEIKQKEDEIKQKEDENHKLNLELLQKEKEIIELRSVTQILKSDHDCIKDIAKQAKNITNNNTTNNKILNIISPLNLNNTNKIKDIIDNNYKLDYIFSGQKGIAKFAFDHILKDDEGNLKYVCTDSSRQIFKYKDELGEIRKDIEAKKLTNFLVEGGIKDKACDIMNEWWTEDTGITNIDKFELLADKAVSLKTIDNDNTEFKKELATMTTI